MLMQCSISRCLNCISVISVIALHIVEDKYSLQPSTAQEIIKPVDCVMQSLLIAAAGIFLCQRVNMIC